jgi:ubiquinone/menaquinone biosynthesis C-methylase UbiE
MYNPQYTRQFYDAYGEREWTRLERSAYFRLEAITHTDFIRRYVKPGDKVLDAGSGPGRFSILLAKIGAMVTVLDISPEQLSLARQKIAEAKVLDHIARFLEADIVDLSRLPSGYFDAVICFGGALSYVCEKNQQAADELIRVTRPGGTIIVSVMSRLGAALGVVQHPDLRYLREPSNKNIDLPNGSSFRDMVESGDLAGFPSSAGITHAPMHLYISQELEGLFRGCKVLQAAGCCVTLSEHIKVPEELTEEPVWANLVELERKLRTDPGLINTGSHIIMAVQKYL